MGHLFAFILVWTASILLSLGGALVLVPVYCLLVFRGSNEREAVAIEKINSTLMEKEDLALHALQKRIASLFNRRACVGVTDSRFILLERNYLGGFKMNDYQWKDLHDATLEENQIPNWFGSNLRFHVGENKVVRIDGVESGVASKIYAVAQEQEHAWEERRRVRSLEETRAASGGMVLSTNPSPNAPSESTVDIVSEIERAKKMRDDGTLSDAEFHELKAKILNRGSA